MSVLFLATDAEALATQLAQEVRLQQTPERLLVPQTIIVPNRFLEQWLKFRLARELGVAINLRFRFLEAVLWDWLREIDPRKHPAAPEWLDDESYRLLVLAVLLLEEDETLKPLQDFCERTQESTGRDGVAKLSRLASRRAWDLAQRLGGLIRDYEYHRQDEIIQPWLHDELGLEPSWHARERPQRAVFQHIIRESDGKRAVLNRRTGRNLKTLPQYVMELLLDVRDYREPSRRCVHLFGLSQISPLHLRALELLVPFFDLKVYHINPLVSRLGDRPDHETLQRLAAAYRGNDRPDALPGTELLHIWGRAGAESLGLTAAFLSKPTFQARLLPVKRGKKAKPTVLSRLQDHLLGRAGSDEPRVPQDRSLQIIGCPGIWREVETVHNSILHHLQQDPDLRQTDIAVLVTDMDVYRPYFTAVFERPPQALAYNLGDFNAARLSVFGQALVGMLDLALESFTRSRVFEVLLNPCFRARLKVDHESALHWLEWADHLGIHHGWSAQEKKEQGFFPSDFYSWKLGMQRLRLGRYMEVADEESRTLPRWRKIIPFADVESDDREKLDAFCGAVEGLLPVLHRLRHFKGPASAWADSVRDLVQRFLQVPDDRPEEEAVRDALLVSLARFRLGDVLQEGEPAALSLALVREFLAGQLRQIPGRHNDLLAGGVTIAALQPQRPIPFAIVYIVGMGADRFPGSSFLSPFDLRHAQRQPGDILPCEQQRYALLETILATRQKLYFTFDERDLQRDQALQPAVPLLQLRRFLEKNVIAGGSFRTLTVPLHGHSERYLEADTTCHDVLVQYRPVERLLALDDALRAGRVRLTDLHARYELEEQRRTWCRTFTATGTEATPTASVPNVTLTRLTEFVMNPAEAALRYHLGYRRHEVEDRPDHEPLVAPQRVARRLVRGFLQDLVQRAETEPLDKLIEDWPGAFERRYEDWMICSRLPDHQFAAVDCQALQEELAQRLTSPRGLFAFLHGQQAKTPCGPVLVGESMTPLGARRRIPALLVSLDRDVPGVPGGQVRLSGSFPVAWESEDAFEMLLLLGKDKEPAQDGRIDRPVLEATLFLMALVAAEAPCVQGRREFLLHQPRSWGIDRITLQAESISPARARAHLGALLSDVLDPACADLLPLGQIRDDPFLRRVYSDPDHTDERFPASLAAKIERDADFNAPHLRELSECGFRVPPDAVAKLRRRLMPLYGILYSPSEEDLDVPSFLS